MHIIILLYTPVPITTDNISLRHHIKTIVAHNYIASMDNSALNCIFLLGQLLTICFLMVNLYILDYLFIFYNFKYIGQGMNTLNLKYLFVLMLVCCFSPTHSMKRQTTDTSEAKGSLAKRGHTSDEPTAPAVESVFSQTALTNYIASFLPPSDFCRFAQVTKTTHAGCLLDSTDQDKPLVYQKVAEYLIENFSNPIKQVLKHTNATGTAVINGTSFNAGQLIDMLQLLGAQICRIANHRRSQEMQACDGGAIFYEWEPPYTQAIPSCNPSSRHDIEHGPWIYLSNSDDLTSSDAITSEDTLIGEDLDEEVTTDTIIKSVRKRYLERKPAGIALDLTEWSNITTDLLEKLSAFPIVSLSLAKCQFADDINFQVLTKFTELRELFIGDDNSPTITDEEFKCICTLTHLQALVLRRTGITTIPSEINQLRELRYLNLQGNSITSLDAITTLDNLRFLVLTNTGTNKPAIEAIPESIRNLKNLRVLLLNNNDDVHGNSGILRTIHPAIGSLTRLKYLDVGGNQITDLPETIQNLRRLKKFHCYGNVIAHLSAGIAHLPKLKHVNFLDTDNPQMTIPTSYLTIVAQGKLQEVGLSGDERKDLRILLKNKEAFRNLLLDKTILIRKPLLKPVFQALEMLFSETITVETVQLLLINLQTLLDLISKMPSQPTPETPCSLNALEISDFLQGGVVNAEWTNCLNAEVDVVMHGQDNEALKAILKNVARTLHLSWKIEATEQPNPAILNALGECWALMSRIYNDLVQGQALTQAHLQSFEGFLTHRLCRQEDQLFRFKNIYNSFLIACLLAAVERNDVYQVETILRLERQLATMHIDNLGSSLLEHVRRMAETNQRYHSLALCVQNFAHRGIAS